MIMVFLLRNTTMRDKRNIVHFNLCLTLLLASLTFVSGVETAKDNKVSYVLHKLYIYIELYMHVDTLHYTHNDTKLSNK